MQSFHSFLPCFTDEETGPKRLKCLNHIASKWQNKGMNLNLSDPIVLSIVLGFILPVRWRFVGRHPIFFLLYYVTSRTGGVA
jgi:hypothetical protein